MAINVILYFSLCLIIIAHTRCKTTQGPVQITPPGNVDNHEENNIDLKYLGETCTNTTQCYSKFPQSTICHGGICSCVENFDTIDVFLGDAGTKKICATAPKLFQPCQSVCEKPTVCKFAEKNQTKICQCLPPNRLINGACYISCKENEFYNPTTSKCSPKCKGNEIDVNSTCYKLVEMNSPCKDDLQCTVGFSECKNNVCTCRAGFTAKNDSCISQATPKSNKDHNCPFGLPHPTASCDQLAVTFCPFDTHQCLNETICCPRMCMSPMIEIKGKCYSTKLLHHSCELQQQCSDPETDCIKGTCECAKGYTIEKDPNQNEACVRHCDESQIPIGDECYQLLKLGDSCDRTDALVACPPNTDCDEKHRCTCLPEMIKLGPNLCGNVPQCHSVQTSPTVGKPKESKIISEVKTKEILKNVTFCKVKNKTAPAINAKLVDKCEKGQYCSSYMESFGICCQAPEQLCPNGKKPVSTKVCDVTDSHSCGPENYCYQQLQLADSHNNDTTGRFCCKT